MTIVRGFTARLYPNKGEAARFNQWAGATRFLWNRLLAMEKAEYDRSGTFLWKKGLQPIAVAMKREPGLEWLADLPAHAVLDTVARLDGALRRMVKERKLGRKCGFPRFKKKFVNEAGIYCVGQATTLSARAVRLPKMGEVRMRGGRLPEGRLLAARVWRDTGRWMLSAQLECARPEPLPASNVVVGIDLGLSTLVTAFDGETFQEFKATRHLRRSLRRLRRAQRALSRRRKGSARRRAQARTVAVIHRKVRERRKDGLHQISHRLTAKAGVVRIEDLCVKGMARALNLGLSVADAGMGRLATFIGYKADWRGRIVEKVSRWFPSSQGCSCCGCINPAMRNLKHRTFWCPDCGHREGRDRNAARNIWYRQEGGNRASDGPTDVEIGDQGFGLVPVGETSTFTFAA